MTQTPNKQLAPYKPGSSVGDLAALVRAEHYAVQAERALTDSREHDSLAWLLNEAQACASLSQAWAWIAVVYQGPGDGPSTQALAQAHADATPKPTEKPVGWANAPGATDLDEVHAWAAVGIVRTLIRSGMVYRVRVDGVWALATTGGEVPELTADQERLVHDMIEALPAVG